jgi:thioredoxin-related protein
MADRKELTIYTLHRSHTDVLDRQFNGRQKRVNYLHTTQKTKDRASRTFQYGDTAAGHALKSIPHFFYSKFSGKKLFLFSMSMELIS